MRATLIFLRKLTLTPADVEAEDVECVRRAGVSEAAIRDAIAVCAVFNVVDRIADTLAFTVPTPEELNLMGPITYDVGYAVLS
jgi:alkylhydroperoxidase family enzyme